MNFSPPSQLCVGVVVGYKCRLGHSFFGECSELIILCSVAASMLADWVAQAVLGLRKFNSVGDYSYLALLKKSYVSCLTF